MNAFTKTACVISFLMLVHFGCDDSQDISYGEQRGVPHFEMEDLAHGGDVTVTPKGEPTLDYTTPENTRKWYRGARFGIAFRFYNTIDKWELWGEDKDGNLWWEMWNPESFDAEHYVDLFLQSGAKYYSYSVSNEYGWLAFDTPASTYDSYASIFAKDIAHELAEASENRLPYRWGFTQDSAIDHIMHTWPYFKCFFTPGVENYSDWRSKSILHLATRTDLYGKAFGFGFGANEGGVDSSAGADHPEREGEYEWYYDQENSPFIGYMLDAQPWMIFNNSFRMPDDPNYESSFVAQERRTYDFPNGLPSADPNTQQSTWPLEGDWWTDFEAGFHNSRTAPELIKTMIIQAGRGTNMGVRVIADGNGKIPTYQEDTLLEVGDWLIGEGMGVSIYGTEYGPYAPGPWGSSTRKQNRIFLHIYQNSDTGEYWFPPLPDYDQIAGVTFLNDGSDVTHTLDDSGLTIDLADDISKDRTVHARVVVVEYDEGYDTLTIPSIKESGYRINIAAGATATATSSSGANHGPMELIPDNLPDPDVEFTQVGLTGNYWKADGGENACDSPVIVEIDLGTDKTFHEISLYEYFNRIRAFEVQYLSGGNWITVYEGKDEQIQFFDYRLAAPVTSRKVRLIITDCEGDAPMIHWFQLWNSPRSAAEAGF